MSEQCWTTRTATGIRNVHSRSTVGPISMAKGLLATLGSSDDAVWPADRWDPIRLDRGLRPGSRGGHGPIRYTVQAADDRSVWFGFDEQAGIRGGHGLAITPAEDGRVVWTHTLEIERPPRLVTHLIVALHDALLEDLLDQVEAVSAGRPLARRRFRPEVATRRLLVGWLEAPGDPVRGGRRWLGWASAAVLAGISALHATWGSGSIWPARDQQLLVRTVLGSPTARDMPGPAACYAVAGALGATSALVLARVSTRPSARMVGQFGVVGAGAVLTARAVFGFSQSGLAPQTVTPEYRKLDLAAYSPLCLALGAALAGIARPDRRWAHRRPTDGASSPAASFAG